MVEKHTPHQKHTVEIMDTIWNTVIYVTQGFMSWVDSDLVHPVALRFLCRDMNLETSQNVFIGSYLTGKSRKQFEVDYNFFNVGLMKLPTDLPGCAFRNARLAVSRLASTLAAYAKESKTKMQSGAEPTYLIDFWMRTLFEKLLPMLMSASLSRCRRVLPVVKSTPTYLTFSSPQQDASTSSLLWAVVLLNSHPEVLDRVRKEMDRIWLSESDAPISAGQLREIISGYS